LATPAVTTGTLLLGAVGSYLSGAVFYPRYASVVFPLFVLVVAAGVAKLADPRLRAAVLVLAAAVGLAGAASNAVDDRTEATRVADVIAREARTGDVVAYCPDMVAPAVSRLLEGGSLREITFPGGRPDLIDWVDYIDRHAAADPVAFASRLLDRTAGDRPTVWFVMSSIYRQGNEGKCESLRAALGEQRHGAVVVRREPTEKSGHIRTGLSRPVIHLPVREENRFTHHAARVPPARLRSSSAFLLLHCRCDRRAPRLREASSPRGTPARHRRRWKRGT
jgi:hypothetical protein